MNTTSARYDMPVLRGVGGAVRDLAHDGEEIRRCSILADGVLDESQNVLRILLQLQAKTCCLRSDSSENVDCWIVVHALPENRTSQSESLFRSVHPGQRINPNIRNLQRQLGVLYSFQSIKC